MFSIDRDSGNMTVSRTLDYENRETYTLTVMAYNPSTSSNSGTPIMNSVTTVKVYVTGVNEFMPQFVQHFYSLQVGFHIEYNFLLNLHYEMS